MNTDTPKPLHEGSVPLISSDLLAEILVTASDFALILSAEDRILSVLVNPHHRTFGRLKHWERQHVHDVLTSESRPKLDRRLEALRETGVSQSVELSHAEQAIWDFPVRYSLHRLSPDNTALMLGRDLRPIAEMQQKLVQAQMALERDYESQREFDTRYRVLMETTSDPIVLISLTTGRIVDLNATAAQVMGAGRGEIAGAPLAQEFDARRRGAVAEALDTEAAAETPAPVEMTLRRSGARVRLHLVPFRAAGERLVMCRLENGAHPGAVLAGVPVLAGVIDDLGESLGRLFHDGADAIAFCDADGVIRCVNESFLNMTDAASAAAVRGRSMADFLMRGSVDLRVLLENARRTGQMRLYPTRLLTAYDGQVSVDIAASWLDARANPTLALVIRDTSRTESLRRSPATTNHLANGAASVMDLVGTATLRDIVSETTEVVEKMCIETAVELTRNNRVAAAEMLGLSRQSLYVKLRKYGLVNKDEDKDKDDDG
ncbi:transcriptional regulator PpsR [Phaeovulum vinaykumarii]|uniref:transcriptional regulator PpsR n=1 Tax=Phaeovulum vinaykumarii TaxID=407234 RepID=UPI000970A132|nr:transcriptional regulator PpsR [Phaeovulum vinaykumarii]